jgi:Lhr-like helicase
MDFSKLFLNYKISTIFYHIQIGYNVHDALSEVVAYNIEKTKKM